MQEHTASDNAQTSTQDSSVGKPTLIVQTVYLHDTDRDDAYALGTDLYDLLSRPKDDQLALGAGVPVFSATAADCVGTGAAQLMVIVPVLGATAFQIQGREIVAKINAWHGALGPGQVLPVLMSQNWRGLENELGGKPLLTELTAPGDGRSATLDEIVLAVARLLRCDDAKPVLFISHAKADLERTNNVAEKINAYVNTKRTGQAFFDSSCLFPGDSLSDQLEEAIRGGVFVAVHSDSYSSRDWCQRELVSAKRQGLPTLTVDVIQRGDPRVSAYGGNGPSMLWDDNPARVASRAMVEWVRARLFMREAARIAAAAQLPAAKIMTRAPELLDVAVGTLQAERAQVVIYPDPELSVAEREILFLGSPRLHLATPSTAYRYLQGGRAGVDTPLDGMQVAMSLSKSPDVNREEGFTHRHLDDAVVYVARCLVSAGAAIAYGGDFRDNGFTRLLIQLIAAYNQTGRAGAEFLHSYLGATIKLVDEQVITHHMLLSEDMRKEAVLPPPDAEPGDRAAFYFSDMRRAMSRRVDACLILGGQTKPRMEAKPRVEEGGAGYGGRYPGVVEEAWRMLQAKKPVYVCGGFGGAAAIVADVLEGKKTPQALRDNSWSKSTYFVNKAKAMDADEFSKLLEYPGSMEDLAAALHQAGAPFLASDKASLKWNGLTLFENKTLFRTRDPVTLAALVFKGLLAVRRIRVEGKLQIELVHGSVTSAKDLDVMSVPVCENVPIGGAAGALDRALGGLLSQWDPANGPLISTASEDLATDWLHLANLGPSLSQDQLPTQVERAAKDAVATVRRYGFERMGVVLYGGTVQPTVKEVAEAMLTEFRALAGRTTLVWFETDAGRFKALKDMLSADEDVHLTIRVAALQAAPVPRADTLLLQVRLDGDQLETTFLPPAGNALAGTRRTTLTADALDKFSTGGGKSGRSTPNLNELKRRGGELANLLLGESADELLGKCPKAQVLIIHNVAASKLPFEMLATEHAASPATKAGLSRRLAIEGSGAAALFAKPPKAAPLEILLVVDPRNDLPGAQLEGEEVKSILEVLETQGHVVPTVLTGEEATISAVSKALSEADVLHYCGHAFFEGPGADQSGLVLADGELTLENLVELETLPRVAFVNACEAGRVRGAIAATEAAAFAEFFLRGGVEAYLGTHWRVGDQAASSFARDVYQGLAAAESLSDAVRKARANLQDADYKDWANYILYGEGRFKLVAG